METKELNLFMKNADRNGIGTLQFNVIHNTLEIDIDDNETISFEYVSQSTGKIKAAMFFVDSIAGLAIEKNIEKDKLKG